MSNAATIDLVTTPRLTLRSDLIRRRIQMGRQFFWVLKDPLSRAYFYFSEREFAILRMFDGGRGLPEVTQECSRQFAPDYVSPESVARFVADAKEKGLVRLQAGLEPTVPIDPAVVSGSVDGRSWRANPLAIRLPGVNPDRFLDWLMPRLK
ncbi:MAG: hypothetical protein HKN47_09440, partial [Pirellulaceae bacterium]|nr:hypothetical protein [Pirellulaceae bacterium]